MSKTFLIEYASGESSATTGKTFPTDNDGGTRTSATWLQCIGPGTVVAVCEGGTIFTKHAVGGEVYKGSFTSLTSTSCQYVVMGNGAAPPAIPQGTTAAGVTIADAGSFTSQTTAEGATQEIYQNIESVQAQINVPLSGAILAAGTPMAAWANNSSSNPGITIANSACYALRWNDNTTTTAVWFGVPMPQDLDDTAAIVLHFLVSKSGATLADATTMTVTAFFQTVAALHDADVDCGGVSSALAGDATAKTVTELTLSIAAADVPPSPSNLSFSVKPTGAVTTTDDVILSGLWIEYKRKILTS